MTAAFKTYAVAHLREVDFGPGIIEYLQKIDATLAPYGGRYVVHGSRPTELEGTWPGDLVIIGSPDRASAEAWYASPAYRAILPLRSANSTGNVVLVDGVAEGHRATDLLAKRGA